MTDPDCQESRPGFLFSDRGWLLKLGLALGILSLLCVRAQRDVAEITPSIGDSALDFEHARGKPVLTWAHPVVAVSPEGFDFDSSAGVFHVTTRGLLPAPAIGQVVTVGGRFVGPRRIEATLVRPEEGYELKRGLNYACSSLTVLVFLFLIRRRFRIRLREGLFRSRY